jgi:hypothetical protein
VPETDAASAETATGSTRRRLLGAGVAGSVLAAFGAQRATASSGASSTTDAESAEPSTTTTSTTTPPGRPTPDDTALLAFILTAELAASELFGGAADVEGIDPAAADLFAVLEEHHRAYANNIAGRLGKAAVNGPNASVLAEFQDDLLGPDAASRGRELELALVATHLDAVGRLVGIDAAGLLASIVVVEAQHSVALGALAGLDADDDFDAYTDETVDPITPDDYPASA